MVKVILTAIVVILALSTTGCSELSDLSQTLKDKPSDASFEILREAELESKWKVTQMRIEIGASDEFSILSKLTDGDKVEGYFYLEEGDDVDFRIEGSSLIYQSGVEDNEVIGATSSDRFSFDATQTQGTTYTLTFRNPANSSEGKSKIALFIEIIYPVTSYTFLPIEAW
ncbi:hypothetical protein ACFLV8_01770 [Chloroflexota bacterium]